MLIKPAFIYPFFSQTFPRCLCYTKLRQDTGDSELHKAAPALQKLTPEGWWVWGEPHCSVVVAIIGHWANGGETPWSGCQGGSWTASWRCPSSRDEYAQVFSAVGETKIKNKTNPQLRPKAWGSLLMQDRDGGFQTIQMQNLLVLSCTPACHSLSQ